MKRWYCVHTKPRNELTAEEHLERQGYEIFLPLIRQSRRRRGKWVEVVEPMFTRYLFVELQLGSDDIGPIRSTRGVCGLVRFTDQPIAVPEGYVESLQATAVRHDGASLVGGSPFTPGDAVLIEDGPLKGLQAVFLAETGEQRAIILLEMLGRQQRVAIKRDLLRVA